MTPVGVSRQIQRRRVARRISQTRHQTKKSSTLGVKQVHNFHKDSSIHCTEAIIFSQKHGNNAIYSYVHCFHCSTLCPTWQSVRTNTKHFYENNVSPTTLAPSNRDQDPSRRPLLFYKTEPTHSSCIRVNGQ